MSTNYPRSAFLRPLEQEDVLCMNLRLMCVERQWGLLGLGLFLWALTLTACVLMVPVAIGLGLLSIISGLWLKFRKVAAERLRPKTVVTWGNPRPASDMAAMFCRYETKLVCGKESHSERYALIARMAHIEEELAELQVFSAAISGLRREEAVPNRREAIEHSRLRKKRRAEGKLEGGEGEDDGGGEQG